MKKNTIHGYCLRIAIFLFFFIGCARVNVESKQPIKLDVTMRLDIYQHVAQDAQAIEDMVASPKEGQGTASNKSSFLSLDANEAYAEEEGEYPADIKDAIDRRKARRADLFNWESSSSIGERADGFVEIKSTSVDATVSRLVEDENNDRRVIYQYVAQKNGTSFEETAKIFAKRIQKHVPAGTPIEIVDSSGQPSWTKK